MARLVQKWCTSMVLRASREAEVVRMLGRRWRERTSRGAGAASGVASVFWLGCSLLVHAKMAL